MLTDKKVVVWHEKETFKLGYYLIVAQVMLRTKQALGSAVAWCSSNCVLALTFKIRPRVIPVVPIIFDSELVLGLYMC